MLPTFIALTLAGSGEANEVPPEDTSMRVVSANTSGAAGAHAGTCHVLGYVVQSAIIRVDFRVANRDDSANTVVVLLDMKNGNPLLRLGYTLPPSAGFGYAQPVYSGVTWVDDVSGYITFEYSGYVENGPKSPVTVNWEFIVGIEPEANHTSQFLFINAALTGKRVPWSRTYGTCG